MVNICPNMADLGDKQNISGYENKDREEIILEWIKKWKMVPYQDLEKTFVKGNKQVQMCRSTLLKKLGNLIKAGYIEKTKRGKYTLYCIPGMGTIKKKTPSELDRLLLDEMKKLLSEIICSGLVQFEALNDYNKADGKRNYLDSDGRPNHLIDDIEMINKLSEKAYTIFLAIESVRYSRDYEMPWPREEKMDYYDTHLQLIDWFYYLLDAIDYLSRALNDKVIEKLPSAGRKRGVIIPL